MFELTTSPAEIINNKRDLFGVYITYEGELKIFDFIAETNIHTNIDEKSVWDTVFEYYNNKIIEVRDISSNFEINSKEMKLSNLTIRTEEDIIKYRRTSYPSFGSLREGFIMSLQHDACDFIYASGGGADNASVKLSFRIDELNEDENILNMIFFTNDGLNVVRGTIHHEYYDDRNPSCITCKEGYNRYLSALEKLGTLVIADASKAAFTGGFIHDMEYGSDDQISSKLRETLFSVLELARIKSIRFVRK